MDSQISAESLRHFFFEILGNFKKNEREAIEIWYEPLEIQTITGLEKHDIENLLEYFDFIKKTKINKLNFISIDKILFFLEALKYIELDIKKLSELLDFTGFETLIYEILLKNDFYAIKNFRFSDKSDFKAQTKQKMYEIDVIGLIKNYLIVIDAKQWKKRDSFSAINKAANLQLRRVNALKNNPEVFSNLIQKLLGLNQNIKKRLPFILIPIMVTLEENISRMNDNLIPLVSIYKFRSFLQEFEKNLEFFKHVEIRKISIQKTLI